MFDLFIVAFIILCVYHSEVSSKRMYYQDYLSKDNTTFLRGILAVSIIFHHLYDYVESNAISSLFRHGGYVVVAIFFFLSGYGLTLGFQEKGKKYLGSIISYKLPVLVVSYVVIGVIYSFVYSLYGREIYIFRDFLKLFGPDSVVRYSWFIVMLIILYLLYWMVFLLCKQMYMRGIIILTVCVVALAYVPYHFQLGSWWFASLFSFPLGCLWAYKQELFTQFLTKHYIPKLLILLGLYRLSFVLAIYGGLTKFSTIPFLQESNLILSSLVFNVIVIMLCMKIKLGNQIIHRIGGYSMEIYLFQGLWIDIALNNNFIVNNNLVFIIIVLIGTFFSAFAFKSIKDRLLKKSIRK